MTSNRKANVTSNRKANVTSNRKADVTLVSLKYYLVRVFWLHKLSETSQHAVT